MWRISVEQMTNTPDSPLGESHLFGPDYLVNILDIPRFLPPANLRRFPVLSGDTGYIYGDAYESKVENLRCDRDPAQKVPEPEPKEERLHVLSDTSLLSKLMSTQQRLSQVASQLFGSGGKSKVLAKNDDDVVIVAALRTAMTKVRFNYYSLTSTHYHSQGGKGGLKDTMPEEYLSHILRATYERAGLDPALIEDIAVGNVLPPGGGASAARMAALHAGIPETTPIDTVNRQCSSGLSAVNQIANEIATGQIDIGIGEYSFSLSFSLVINSHSRCRCRKHVSILRPSCLPAPLLRSRPIKPTSTRLSHTHGHHIRKRSRRIWHHTRRTGRFRC
jgi:hypothetical protein